MFGFMFGWAVFWTLFWLLILTMGLWASNDDAKSAGILGTVFSVIFMIAVIAGRVVSGM
jgi:hypothetical protein